MITIIGRIPITVSCHQVLLIIGSPVNTINRIVVHDIPIDMYCFSKLLQEIDRYVVLTILFILSGYITITTFGDNGQVFSISFEKVAY